MADANSGRMTPRDLLIANYLLVGYWEASAKECLGLGLAPFVDPAITARFYQWLAEAKAVKQAIAAELGPDGVADAEAECDSAVRGMQSPKDLSGTGHYRTSGKVSRN